MAKESVPHSREAIAYHEAGHANADFRAGFNIECVSIKPNPETGSLGHASSDYESFGYDQTPAHLEKVVVGLLAGYAAEVRFGTDEPVARVGAEEDFEKAEEWLQRYGLDESIEEWLPKAARFVETEWKAIETIAAQLLEHETLAWEELSIIVDWSDTGDPEPPARPGTVPLIALITTMLKSYGNPPSRNLVIYHFVIEGSGGGPLEDGSIHAPARSRRRHRSSPPRRVPVLTPTTNARATVGIAR